MEQSPHVDESTIINSTVEQLDTWNQPRSDEALRGFVTSRMVRIVGADALDDFDLAA